MAKARNWYCGWTATLRHFFADSFHLRTAAWYLAMTVAGLAGELQGAGQLDRGTGLSRDCCRLLTILRP